MHKEIVLDIFHEQLVINIEDGGGNIVSGLERETCPACSKEDCNFSCDGSQGAYTEDNAEDEDDVAGRLAYNGFLDAIESLALAHAIAGINVSDPAYVGGIKTALEAAGNNL